MGNEYYEYTTIQGDTFDSIALDFYNEEHYSTKIIQANLKHLDKIILPAGIVLKIPVILEAETAETLPPWRR